jgi:hypothetical protein
VITVRLKAQNFKNKTIKQSYNIEFLPSITGLYINKNNIYTKKMRFQAFEYSIAYYIYYPYRDESENRAKYSLVFKKN